MKLLLVSQDDYVHQIIETNYEARNVALLHYRNPVKAIDNVEELEPDIVIFSAEDFPRHWKPFIRLYRSFKGRGQGIFILLTGNLFPEEEITKATYLEVTGLVTISYDNSEFIENLDEILSRYMDIDDLRSGKRYRPREYDDLEFVFNHPESSTIITGKLLDISGLSISFRPDNTLMTGDLEKDSLIDTCSFQVGQSIFDCRARVVRNQGVLVLELVPQDNTVSASIDDYIRRKSERSMAYYRSRV